MVQKGHSVSVVSHNPARKHDIEAMGAAALIGSIEDIAFLTASFMGADAVYTMVPPSSQGFTDPGRDKSIDTMMRWNNIMNNYTEAIQKSGVKRIVHLSSIGAHMHKDSGLLIGHYNAEQTLDRLHNVNITFMRPTAFYYNLLAFIPAIKKVGFIASNYGADDIVPWVSPADIAASIAEEITIPLQGRKVLYVASEELSCNEVAGILGNAIGKPGLSWNRISNEEMLKGFERVGMPKDISIGLVEMQSSMHNGKVFEDYNNNKPVLGKIKLKEYAVEFAAAYNKA